MFDLHCHLDHFDDPDRIVAHAKEAGVTTIITHGTDLASNLAGLDLQKTYPEVIAALGLYPTDAVAMDDAQRKEVFDLIRQTNPVVIGEVGLDYYHDDTKKDEMKAAFSIILDIAEDLQKPVVIHSRKAEADVIEMLEGRNVTADLHCFTGSLKLAKKAAAMGVYFSIPATIVKATQFQRMVEELPIELLLTETDAPWLSPDENQNEPANIALVVNAIAAIKDISVQDCEKQLEQNLARFLKLS